MNATLRRMVRHVGLEPSDLNLERLQVRAELAFAAGASPLEAYSHALGVDLSLPSHGGSIADGAARARWTA